MPVLRKARKTIAIFAATGVIGVVSVAAYIYCLKLVSVQTDRLTAVQTDVTESSSSELLQWWNRLRGCNNPAPPPIIMSVGRPPGQDESTDLSTPAVAVYSVLSLIDQTATNKLAPCFIKKKETTAGNLYPRYLGNPVGLVEVIEKGESAEVIWNATVHNMFSLDGRKRSPGETITLTTRLVRVDGLWKLLRLHEGGKDGPR